MYTYKELVASNDMWEGSLQVTEAPSEQPLFLPDFLDNRIQKIFKKMKYIQLIN